MKLIFLRTNGGRVLNVVSVQENAEKAREIAYRIRENRV